MSQNASNTSSQQWPPRSSSLSKASVPIGSTKAGTSSLQPVDTAATDKSSARCSATSALSSLMTSALESDPQSSPLSPLPSSAHYEHATWASAKREQPGVAEFGVQTSIQSGDARRRTLYATPVKQKEENEKTESEGVARKDETQTSDWQAPW